MKLWAILLLSVFTSLRAQALEPEERVLFHTSAGDIVVSLFAQTAPRHTAQFLKMVRAGVYNGMAISRLEKGFVAQVYPNDSRGLTAEQSAAVSKIPAEFSAIPHRRGILSMAREDGDPNSAEFSFSFILGDAPHLDGRYTVFGEVVQGLDVLAAIEKVPVENTAPVLPLRIERAEVVSASQLIGVSLESAHSPMRPFEIGKIVFEALAGLMFAFTVSTPVFKSIFA